LTNIKTFSYFLSLTIVIAIVAYLVMGNLLAIPLASAAALLWMVQDEVKNRTISWTGMLLHALFLSVIITVIAAIITDEWINILPFILGGSFLLALDNKIRQSGSKNIKSISDIVEYALIASVIIYWYLNRGLDVGLVGFIAGLVIKSISGSGKNNSDKSDKLIATLPEA